jgi:uncharacterized membrane protein (UPF0127 family)
MTNWFRRKHIIVCYIMIMIAAGVLVASSSGRAQDAIEFGRASLIIETSKGSHWFDVEVAESDAQRARGLMFRNEMAPDAGMIFLYRRDRILAMWMANTYLPLDMLFIAADGQIVHIAENTIPLSRATISSRRRARAVLELNAGTASRLDISVGDRVVFDGLPPR